MVDKSFLNYLEFQKRYSKHTITAYHNDLKQFDFFLLEQSGLEDMSQANHFQIRSWIVSMLQDNMTARSINRKLSSLNTYFKFLLQRKEIAKNPMRKVQGPKEKKRLPGFIKTANLERLFEIPFSKDFKGSRDHAIMKTLYSCGLRRAELIDLKIGSIDFNKQELKVLGKRNKERLVPFGEDLADCLNDYLDQREKLYVHDDAAPLFINESGKVLYPKKVYNIVTTYLSRVTTNEFKNPHILRHSFATHLSNNGASLNAIKELLGHANLAATQIYTHNSIEKLKEVYKSAHPKATDN